MHTRLMISGTHCESCKALIEDVASETEGIRSCTVDYKTGEARVEHDNRVDWDGFSREIAKLGSYSITERRTL